MTTACMTPPPTGTDSLRCSRRRRGGDKPACGQLLRHLTTGFGQLCGVRWTPPGCPLAPTHDCDWVWPESNQSLPIKGEHLLHTQSAESALVKITAPYRWAIPE